MKHSRIKRIRSGIRSLAILTLFFTQIGCKTSDPVQMSKEEATEMTPQTNPTTTLHISYFSIAYGIDYQNLSELETMLKAFQEKRGTSFTIEKVSWGREGEVSLCIDVRLLSESLKAALEEEVRALIIRGKNVRIEKNKPCRR